MRFSFASTLVVALAAEGAVASTWFGKTVYNKWHETELERWLSDNNVPYPTPADRKDLENLVKSNWNDKVVTPYNSWDTKQLQNYLTTKGYQAKKGTEKNKDGLVAQVKSYWSDTEESVNSAYSNVRDWIFDSWTDSQLKSYADKNGIPVPQPRTRDSLLKTVRENYQSAANKVGETAAYPGNWLYESWTESELKSFLDERGIPAPQPSTRDKLVASVRRNSYLASKDASAKASVASASIASAKASLSDLVFDAWSDSQIKDWADKNGIKVPQGSKRNELVALARKHRAAFLGDNVASSASSAYGAATSQAGNYGAQATDGAVSYFDWIRAQLGLLGADASASYVSATNAASSAASSASVSGSKSGYSASSVASKSGKSGVSSASKGAKKASDAATESATQGKNRVGEAAQKATDYIKEEL
ncbi:hypothetical protein BU16DRAFT_502778 [Lophium mytilinum]|uniref:Stress response protein ish1 n=1 Tax=Lophium mytilinum TaxID=390894 RepID=A0A6A6R7L3_9PEZI|nr:hypothetical protein BU16DRAFT_502778 [Lophium mytilinum]